MAEPQYRGTNGHVDALAAAWLFANDVVFFNEGEITWDGKHHSIVGMQNNLAKFDEVPVFLANRNGINNGIVDLLTELEKDEELIVPREKISPALYDIIGEGDLTGITLFNLQAYGRAFQFMAGSNIEAYGSYLGLSDDAVDDSNWETVKSVLQMAGLSSLLDNPTAKSMVRVVMYDTNLSRGIPGFFKLVRRMYEDMLAYNDLDLPFILVFMSSFNVDARQLMGGEVEEPVAGAETDSMHIEMNVEEWDASHQSPSDTPESEEGSEPEEETSERDAQIALLKLFVLTGELANGAAFPQELKDELDRAEAGDESVDLDDLAERLNACTPDEATCDYSNITFDERIVAAGRRFEMAIPDGWSVVKGFKENLLLTEQVRPFVAVPGVVEDESVLPTGDRITYSALVGDRDPEFMKLYEECGTDDMLWAMLWWNSYDRSEDTGGDMKPHVVWDTEVKAFNTTCLVTQNLDNGCEFYIRPYALDHSDSVRVTFAKADEADYERLREVAIKMASTVRLDKVLQPSCVSLLNRALITKVKPDDFKSMVEGFAKPHIALRQQLFNAGQYRYAGQVEDLDEKEATIAGAEAIAKMALRAASAYERLMDAYDKQVILGTPTKDLAAMLEALEWFEKNAFPTPDLFDDASDKALIRSKGVFSPSAQYSAARIRRTKARSDLDSAIRKAEREEAEAKRKAEEAERKRKEQERIASQSVKAEIAKIYAELDAADSYVAPSKIELESVKSEMAALESERKGLGFFGNGARKKEIKAALQELSAKASSLEKAIVEEEKSHALEAAAARKRLVESLALQARRLPDGALKKWMQVQSSFLKLEPGDRVSFGTWEKKPMYWRVAKKTDKNLVLLAEDCLAAVYFDDSWGSSAVWEDCSLRSWLKRRVPSSFNDAEKSFLVEVALSNSMGPQTVDTVYCPSSAEVSEMARDPKVRPWLKIDSGVFAVYWWTRTVNPPTNQGLCTYPTVTTVTYDGGFFDMELRGSNVAVRPCVQVSLDARPSASLLA